MILSKDTPKMIQPIQPYAFRRAKGERVVVEYVVFDKALLDKANSKHPLIAGEEVIPVTSEMLQGNMLEDYMQVMRLCKTYIADPEVFALCREIERRISEIIESRFLLWGRDRHLFSNKPLPLTTEEESDEAKID